MGVYWVALAVTLLHQDNALSHGYQVEETAVLEVGEFVLLWSCGSV
jgi:hypothetical protein